MSKLLPTCSASTVRRLTKSFRIVLLVCVSRVWTSGYLNGKRFAMTMHLLTFSASSPAWITGAKTVSVSLVSANISGIWSSKLAKKKKEEFKTPFYWKSQPVAADHLQDWGGLNRRPQYVSKFAYFLCYLAFHHLSVRKWCFAILLWLLISISSSVCITSTHAYFSSSSVFLLF